MTVPMTLSLIQQLHGLRREFGCLAAAVERQPAGHSPETFVAVAH